MAINFPLSLTNFFDKLTIIEIPWQLSDNDEYSGLGTGQILTRQLAPKLWTGRATLKPLVGNEPDQVQALIETLDGSMNDFYAYNPRRKYPQDDPRGTKLGASLVQIASIGANNKSMTLKGLPTGYKLTVGDFLSFDYGTSPVRRAFHRVCETVVTAGTGITPLFEVRPHIRPGAAVNATVTLVKPAMRAFIMPNSFDPGSNVPEATTGMSFQLMQRIA